MKSLHFDFFIFNPASLNRHKISINLSSNTPSKLIKLSKYIKSRQLRMIVRLVLTQLSFEMLLGLNRDPL